MKKDCKEKSLGYVEHITGTGLNLDNQGKLPAGRR